MVVEDEVAIPDAMRRIPNLYHFTDRRNLTLIRELGGILPMAVLQQKGIKVPAPGGNQWSRDADEMKGMGRYVHLCFKANHPMEYVARQDGRIQDSIFLQVHPDVLALDEVMFTADVANKAGVEAHSLRQAAEMIDFDVLYTWTNWSDAEVQQRLQRAEKYEILVPHSIPLTLIRNLPDG
jgi:hypothetical protein